MNTITELQTIVTEINPPIRTTIIWLHGLGADGHDFADIIPQLQLPTTFGVRFIFPHAPIRPVSINNGFKMRAWYDIYRFDDLNQEDIEGLRDSQRALEQLIDQQRESGIAADHIILAGFSQGGAVALYTGLRYAQSLAGILGLSTYLPAAKQLPEEAHPANQQAPIFLAHGSQDPVIPLTLGKKTRDYLQETKHLVEWHEYPMGHQVCMPEINDIRNWLLQLK